ncbi:hypothetical protein OHT59_40595 [Streptomyces sp. NBC_00243]|uniref:hypothetical protein n=1 Tax=Streptomyces sp. NBC_00243 TaxID=2975688 RepID=UPI002DD7DCD3|nr:hypothetical protein [Streptomyces sp. NBC_00243]WRZ24373.1 hypothetical protein OHT59_40595 [Streptomyces sp. NBC_00243]
MSAENVPAPYDPAPGSEYSYALSDYARAAARALGPGWGAESGFLGAWGLVFTLDARVSLRLFVDHEGDLCFEDRDGAVVFTDRHWIRPEKLPEGAPSNPDEMAVWGEAIAAVIRDAVVRETFTA